MGGGVIFENGKENENYLKLFGRGLLFRGVYKLGFYSKHNLKIKGTNYISSPMQNTNTNISQQKLLLIL